MPIHIATYQDAAKKLADTLPKVKEKVVVRLGGTMPYEKYPIQINSASSVSNSINKLAQKNLLIKENIKTQPLLDKPIYPCVIKGIVRSKGTKVFVVRNEKEYQKACADLQNQYYIEPLFETTSEYRLHCTQKEVFFAVKKFKRNPEDIIVRHNNHYNKRDFIKPRKWEDIKAECIKAMKALNLDIACFDVLYCSKDNNNHVFVIAEANTNPELLNNTYNAYNNALTDLILGKIEVFNKNKPAVKPPKNEQPVKANLPILTPEQLLAAMANLVKNNYHIDHIDGEHITLTVNFVK